MAIGPAQNHINFRRLPKPAGRRFLDRPMVEARLRAARHVSRRATLCRGQPYRQ